jgi:hypothetical protein
MNHNFIIYILIIQIIVLIIIKLYSFYITQKYVEKECNDPLNRTFFKLRFSFWNVSHIIVFFIYCLILKPVNFIDHLKISMIGIIWYIIQYIFHYNTKNYKKKCNHSVSYENMLKPRLDDFIYNTLGQIIYFIMVKGYCIC